MIKRVIIVPYRMASKSAKALKEGLVALNIRCFRKLPPYVGYKSDLIFYYGGNNIISDTESLFYNKLRHLANNKLKSFQIFKEANLPTVEWTTDVDIAKTWPLVVARATLTGHSGQGIHMWNPSNKDEPVPIAPLYTKYVKKTYECRVHVFNGEVIDAQIKRKLKEYDGEVDTNIRNHTTGWVYCRDNFEVPEEAKLLSLQAIKALHLDFGAVDLIYNQHYNQFYLLEVNTAPGLEGTTLTNYIKAIKNAITSR